MKSPLQAAWASVLIVAAACGGATKSTTAPNPRGSASVSGTVDGKPVPANDAVATKLTSTNNGVTTTSITISITSVADACPCAVTSGYSTVLVLEVGVLGTSLSTGTYSFPAGNWDAASESGAAEAHYVVNNPGTTLLPATSGSITISQVGSSMTVGTFDIAFSTGDHLTGTFSAPSCAAALDVDAAACP